jgi:predicted ATPase
MNDFKLIAIRPLKGCSSQYRKVLKEGVVYQFYNDYQFIYNNEAVEPENREIVTVKNNTSTPTNFYKVEGKNFNVNISAIVGKNGSGKSALFELFYLALYLISVEKEIIEPNFSWIDKELAKSKVTRKRKLLLISIKETLISHFKDIRIELFFSIGNKIYYIKFNERSIKWQVLNEDSKINNNLLSNIQDFDLDNFFYTIAVNYSIYSLLPNFSGKWLIDVFHKNDGYQTPLVINPFRDEDGIIDVVRESHLAQTRLICNLINDEFQVKEVLKGKSVSEVIFEITTDENPSLLGYSLKELIDRFTKKVNLSRDELFNQIYSSILKTRNREIDFKKEEIKYYPQIVDYTIGKFIKIVHLYKQFSNFRAFDDIRVNGAKASLFPSIDSYEKYLNQLSNTDSHITLKLKQILNCVRYNLLNDGDIFKWEKGEYRLPIKELSERIKTAISDKKGKLKKVNVVEFIPAALFKPNIIIENNSNTKNKFVVLSSGELQLIHTTQSIYYHILNLNSISKKVGIVKYDNVNLFLDEVELYFHPEFQRNFISELLNGLKHLNISIYNLNICFSTHSPFILSDILNSNILRINNGNLEVVDFNDKTFGGNIHQLLTDNFFLDNTIGEFALQKIKEIILFYEKVVKSKSDMLQELISEYVNLKVRFEFIVDSVGEKYIKGVLKNHLEVIEEKLGITSHIESKIKALEFELSKLKSMKNDKA